MQYTQFGDTGMVVSRMALGTMTFGNYNYQGFKSNVGEKEARDIVAMALNRGINFFDTADMYAGGQSEELLGRTLGVRRHDVFVCTKAFFRTGPAILHAGLSRRHIIEACEESLGRLKTDYIDLFLLHNYDRITPFEETARALDDLQRQGKVRYVGESNFFGWQAEKMIATQKRLGFAPLVAAQVYYSLLTRDIEWEIVPQAKSAGMGIMAWGPLAGGFLTGKYKKGSTEAVEGRRKTFDFPPVDGEAANKIVDKLAAIAKKNDATPAETALAWMLSKPFLDTVIVGVSKLEQLESNLKAEKLELPKEIYSELDDLTKPPAPYPQWMQWGEAETQKALEKGWEPEQTN